MEHELRRSDIPAAVRGEITKRRAKRNQLAAGAGISPATLRSRLKGDKPFNIDELVVISHLLHVPVAEMLDRAGVK